MAVNDALSQVQGFNTKDPYSTGIGKLQYRAANIETEQVGPSELHQIFDSLMGMVKPLNNAYDTYLQKDAKERFNSAQVEYDKTGDPGVFKKRIDEGTLFNHDNPYTYSLVHNSMGRRMSYEIADRISSDISNGLIKTNNDLELSKKKYQDEYSKQYGENFQLDINSPEFQKGFTLDLEQQNQANKRAFDKYRSEETKRLTQFSVLEDFNSLINDPNTSPEAISLAMQTQGSLLLSRGIDPTPIFKAVYQQAAQSTRGSVLGPALAKTYVPLGTREDGSASAVSISSLVGGDTVVETLQLQADKQRAERSVSEMGKWYKFKESLMANEDPSAVWELLQNFKNNYKNANGISPELYSFIDSETDKAWQDYSIAMERKNKATKEALDKQALNMALDKESDERWVNSLLTGDVIDFNTAQSSYGNETQTKASLERVGVRRINEMVLDESLDLNTRTQNFFDISETMRTSPTSQPYRYMSGQISDALAGKGKALNMFNEMYQTNPNQFYQTMHYYGKEGKELGGMLSAINDGGISLQDYLDWNNKIISNPDFEKKDKAIQELLITNDSKGLLPENGAPMSEWSALGMRFRIMESKFGSEYAKKDLKRQVEARTVSVGGFLGLGGSSFVLPKFLLMANGEDGFEITKQAIESKIKEANIPDAVVVYGTDSATIMSADGTTLNTLTITIDDAKRWAKEEAAADRIKREEFAKDKDERLKQRLSIPQNQEVKPTTSVGAYPYR